MKKMFFISFAIVFLCPIRILAANYLAQRGITSVIAGNFGSKMVNTLDNKSIAYFELKGVVDTAVKKVLKLN